jgi:small subunit ribosomal protein S13
MRILGITLPEEKRIEIGLTVLYGVGRPLAHTILNIAKVEYGLKPKELTVEQENAIRKAVESYKIEGDLKREVAGNIKRLKDIKTYRGSREQRQMLEQREEQRRLWVLDERQPTRNSI